MALSGRGIFEPHTYHENHIISELEVVEDLFS